MITLKTKKTVENYNVIWNTPSINSSGSMPIGNGDTGLNVWVEEDGDLLFYIAKADAYDNNHRPIKLGRIRIRLSPNPFMKGLPFLQTLNLYESEINITAGEEENEINLIVWVDANQQIVHVNAKGKKNFEIGVNLELWRDKERPLTGAEAHCAQENLIVFPDTIVERTDGVMWFYRNKNTNDTSMINRTSGAFIKAGGLINKSNIEMVSVNPSRNFSIRIYPLVSQTETTKEWVEQLEENIFKVDSIKTETARMVHKKWWADFWDRSHIFITGKEDAFAVSQGYILQRFMYACAGRSKAPIQFNGTIFNVDVYKIDCEDTSVDELRLDYRANEIGFNADYRRWGGLMWWQNTRLVYWPMIVAGDFDFMLPLLNIYTKVLPDAKKALKEGMGYDGAAVFSELAKMGGAIYRSVIDDNGKRNEVSHIYYQIIELALMMLDYCIYSNDEEYLINEAIPMADAGIRFYDQHFKRNTDGKINIYPANACETYWSTTNPTNEIAGLKYLITRLFSLPERFISNEQNKTWKTFFHELPEISINIINDKRILAPAQIYGERQNTENPELYAVFPFRIYGVGKPDLEIAEATFENRILKETGCWFQDAIDAAYIGDIEHARKCVVENFTRKNPSSRFPAFWVAGNDWIPDLDNGGVGMIALQGMLMQTEGDNILLFPTWPKDWDVEFKLIAPKKTIIEGSYKGGKLISLKVIPEYREKDIVYFCSR